MPIKFRFWSNRPSWSERYALKFLSMRAFGILCQRRLTNCLGSTLIFLYYFRFTKTLGVSRFGGTEIKPLTSDQGNSCEEKSLSLPCFPHFRISLRIKKSHEALFLRLK